jgi:hypothetical protein
MKCKIPVVFALCAWSAVAANAPRFEAAAIHPHDPKLLLSTMQFANVGDVSIYGMTIRNLIWIAWKLPPERVSGGPKWVASELYDIQAKAPRGSSNAESERWARLQTLLADRLHLRVHREAKSESVYFLRLAKGGLRMERDSSPSGKGSILPWGMIVSQLSGIVGRTVVDETGLKGAWHFGIRYSTEDGTPAARGIARGTDPGPSIFTAVQEQLGLRLDAGKAPVDHLVIDSVERPSGN